MKIGQFAICAIIKNEAHYLAEWIEYHLLIGIERFFIYNNCSTDHTGKILECYSDVVEQVDWVGIINPQKEAYTNYLDYSGHRFAWTAFIDADEFIVYKGQGRLIDYLNKNNNCMSFRCSWEIFDSNGLMQRPEGLIIENNLRRHSVPPAQNHKSICKTETIDSQKIESPHRFAHTQNGNILMPDKELLSVYHYMLRSREDVIEKVSRGNAWDKAVESKRLANIDLAVRQILDKYEGADLEDRYMIRYADAIKERIRRRCVPEKQRPHNSTTD